jgi:hypothetical protein
MRRGESTPILDFLVFRKIRSTIGGRVRLMFSGGAPLSPETNDFIRVCMGCPLLQVLMLQNAFFFVTDAAANKLECFNFSNYQASLTLAFK